jgi:hypothetical protein
VVGGGRPSGPEKDVAVSHLLEERTHNLPQGKLDRSGVGHYCTEAVTGAL